jgi:hypothetical protein
LALDFSFNTNSRWDFNNKVTGAVVVEEEKEEGD